MHDKITVKEVENLYIMKLISFYKRCLGMYIFLGVFAIIISFIMDINGITSYGTTSIIQIIALVISGCLSVKSLEEIDILEEKFKKNKKQIAKMYREAAEKERG